MSESRLPWTKDEKALLQELRSLNAKLPIVDLTTLFNAKNGRLRTEDAIRNQLKLLRRSNRTKEIFGRGVRATQPEQAAVETWSGDALHERFASQIPIVIPTHPSLAACSTVVGHGSAQNCISNCWPEWPPELVAATAAVEDLNWSYLTNLDTDSTDIVDSSSANANGGMCNLAITPSVWVDTLTLTTDDTNGSEIYKGLY